MPSLSLTDMMYCTPEKKSTPASDQGVGVDVLEIALHDSVVFSEVQTIMEFESIG
jgi:hypothetical protein